LLTFELKPPYIDREPKLSLLAGADEPAYPPRPTKMKGAILDFETVLHPH